MKLKKIAVLGVILIICVACGRYFELGIFILTQILENI